MQWLIVIAFCTLMLMILAFLLGVDYGKSAQRRATARDEAKSKHPVGKHRPQSLPVSGPLPMLTVEEDDLTNEPTDAQWVYDLRDSVRADVAVTRPQFEWPNWPDEEVVPAPVYAPISARVDTSDFSAAFDTVPVIPAEEATDRFSVTAFTREMAADTNAWIAAHCPNVSRQLEIVRG